MTRAKILIIENESDLARSISDFLEMNDYQTSMLHSGEEAIEWLLHETPDLIICDLMMPGMNGYDVLDAVRQIRKLAQIPFLFLTGMAEEEYRRAGMIKGADDFISKPFKFDQLLASIQSALEKNNFRTSEIKRLSTEIENQLDSINQVNYLTNHMVRANLANIMLTLELLQSGELATHEALGILYESAGKIDHNTADINNILHQDKETKVGTVPSKLKYDKVMLVDDDPTQLMLNKMVISKVLDTDSIVTFTDGLAALDHLATHQVDVIFLDLNMPNMSGMEVLEAIKVSRLNIPVIMLSSSLDPAQINSCYSYENVTQYLVKPLNPERLKRVIA